MFIPHSVQADVSFCETALEFTKCHTESKLHVLGNLQLLSISLQFSDTNCIFFISASANEDKLEQWPAFRRNGWEKFLKCLQLQAVILLRAELRYGNNLERPGIVPQPLVEWDRQKFRHIARWIYDECVFGCLPQTQYVSLSPRGVYENQIASTSGNPVRPRKHAIVGKFESTKNCTVWHASAVVVVSMATFDSVQHVCTDGRIMHITARTTATNVPTIQQIKCRHVSIKKSTRADIFSHPCPHPIPLMWCESVLASGLVCGM